MAGSLESINSKNRPKIQNALGFLGLSVSLLVVLASFWLCLFKGLPLTVVWTALGFHVSYQILYWNKRVSASVKGLEIKNEETTSH